MHKKGRLASILAVAAVLALFVSACGKKEDSSGANADTSVSGSVKVSGSSTVEPISSAVAEAFSGENGKVEIDVQGPGTGDGFKVFCNDETDISDASRPIKKEEADACAAKGVEYIELKVALDGLSVIVNPDNPLECLNFADLYALVGPESKGFENWTDAQALAKELGSDTTFPDEKLDITAPGEESGTYDSFIEIALQKIGEGRAEEGKLPSVDDAKTTRPDYQASPNDNNIVQGVEGSAGGFGWVGFAFADGAGGDLKKMPISSEPGGDCVEPSQDTIKDGSYPLSRSLYVYVNAKKAQSNKAVAAYVDYYLDGLNGFVEGADYTTLPDDAVANTKKVWDARTVGSVDGGE
jgi:phosphate transport system substrate-binding protein